VQQLLGLVSKSNADYRLLAGDLNVDPRDGEVQLLEGLGLGDSEAPRPQDTYKALKGSGLKDSVEEFYKVTIQ
jgi:hypothetical protein